MHGCANGNVVYGWRDCDNDNVIDREWLDYKEIYLFCSYQVKNYASGNAIYGLPCKIDVNTGIPFIDEIEKQKVHKAYTDFIIYKEYDSKEAEIPKLGYYIGVDGDMDWEYYDILYIPFPFDDDDYKSEES